MQFETRVIVVPDGRFYFAQGLDEDYGAQGDTIEEAKANFQQGFTATMQLRMRRGARLIWGPPSQERMADFFPVLEAYTLTVEVPNAD